jgi:hypothetical protein
VLRSDIVKLINYRAISIIMLIYHFFVT